ncbi:MAG: carboxypeptidase-like regulatory domain-containing protein [bacterium]|nr:carboxypeptidase-like regulatory domain-containing protein [bacterium]
MKKFGFLGITLALAIFNFALAGSLWEAGNVQLSVGGVLLDIVTSPDDLEIDFNSDNIIVTTAGSFKIASSDRRALTVSPSSANTASSCESSESTVTVTGSSVTITVGSGICTNNDSGGGVGGGGGSAGPGTTAPAPAPAPAPTPPPPPPPPPPQPGLEISIEEESILENLITLPEPITEVVETVTEQVTQATEAITEQFSETVEAVTEAITETVAAVQQAISQTPEAVNTIASAGGSIASSFTSGFNQIFKGFSSGNVSASANITENIFNTGNYSWDTGKPFSAVAVVPSSKLADLPAGDDYTVTIISASDANIQDTSDSAFSVVDLGSALNFSKLNFVFLKNKFLNQAYAQDNSYYIKVLYPNGGEAISKGSIYNIRWESNLPPTNLVKIYINKQFLGFDAAAAAQILKGVNQEVGKKVGELRANPIVAQTVKQVAAPLIATVGAVSVGAVAVSASASSASAAANLAQFLQYFDFARLYLLGLLRFKKRKPWGKIIDKLSGKPLSKVSVQIYDAEFKKLKDAQATDEEGRFNALTVPGTYYLKISKDGYQEFQTENIIISSSDQVISLELALVPLGEEFTLAYLRRINFLSLLKRFIDLINPYLLALGTFISLISLAIVPSAFNYLLVFIYLILDFLKIYLYFHLIKPFGEVKDIQSSAPLTLAVVRVFDADKNWLLATKATDDKGRFSFLLAPGNYYLTATKSGHNPFKSGILTLKKSGLASIDIKM